MKHQHQHQDQGVIAPIARPTADPIGRSARREVRNPLLALPAAQAIQALPAGERALLGLVMRQLATQADGKAHEAWGKRKGIMAAYWRAVSTYSKHLARVIDPPALRRRGVAVGGQP